MPPRPTLSVVRITLGDQDCRSGAFRRWRAWQVDLQVRRVIRSQQVWDPVSGEYQERAVPAAVTVTVADMLATGGDAKRGRALDIAEIDLETGYAGAWLDDLAVWAGYRVERGTPSASVVSLSAPELAGEQLIPIAGLAEVADIAASTLRAYVARGEGEVPAPQAVIAGRAMWARPVAEEWTERRRSSAESVDAALATRVGPFEMSPGLAALTARLTKVFFSHLWESGWRKRWALRWRTRDAVEEVARGLSWDVAASIGRIVPLPALAVTVRHAVLDDIAEQHAGVPEGEEWSLYGITRPVARMLTWLISHDPDLGAGALGEIVADAHRRMGIPAGTTVRSLRTALHLDSDLEGEALNTYLDRVLAPIQATGTSGDEVEEA